MPTIQVNVTATKQQGDLLFLELEYDGRRIEMTANQGMTILEIAQLAVNQNFPERPNILFDGTAEITFHTETILDEDGNEQTIRVVDDVARV